MDKMILVKLTSKAWSLTILSLMFRGVPGRQAPLLAKSGASRTAFSQSLHHLIEIGLMERNPGHGHPLRPEFRLTDQGKVYARVADRILKNSPAEGLPVLRRNWTVPVLSELRKPLFFNEIRAGLPNITDRALSQSLQVLEGQKWVHRNVIDDMRPPRPQYTAVNDGLKISQAVPLT